jgi:TPP-dependent pyruvate/acetoin dehydrogenase alpha subunit
VELTPQAVHVAGAIWRRAAGYDMPGERVDGNDIGQVAEVVGKAVARARAGEGPTMIEAVTYRWFGHYAGDKAAYREPDEVREWHGKDAVALARGRLDTALADEIDADVERQIQAALKFALDSEIVGPDILPVDHLATT